MIALEIFRMRIGLHYSRQVKVKGIEHINFFEFLIIMSLLFISGIERNPGPASTASSSSSSSSTTFEEKIIKEKFSVVHYNVQSITNKLDLIETEFRNFDVICLTETWLDIRTSDDLLDFKDFKLYRRDRIGDSHGGICVYVRNNIYSCRRNDLELPDIECVWIEVKTHNIKQLIGTFYRPPNSSNNVISTIEDSIGLAFDTNIKNILITGDFNLDILKQVSNKKVIDLCQHYNLEQLINEPTNFTETSSTIIDLFLTANKNNVLLCGVGDPFLDQNVRYHCPIYCVFKFNNVQTPVYTRKIYLYDRGNYQSISDELSETDWNKIKNNDIDIYANNLTEHILALADKHIPNKTIKIRKSDPSWLTNNIKRLIRKKKRLYDKYKKTNNMTDFENYKHIRNQVTNEIRKSKSAELENLSEKLKDTNIRPNSWWKTLKYFIKPDQNSTIPPLNRDGVIYCNDSEKSNILNAYFVEQTIIEEDNATLPPTLPLPTHKLDSISVTPDEVQLTLNSLQLGKAAGPDSINNRLLKELAQPLSFPLSDIFNYSLSTGKLPSIWKL
ncbi:MAG: endonuclease/exonuclease/phosphatase family protein, partial [Candidatus Thiodiazotropha sp.]